MIPTEVVILTRYVAAMCPAQKFDEYTPDAWFDVLSDLQFDDARQAVATLAKHQTFVSPAEIRGQVKAIRTDRIDRYEAWVQPDAELSPAEYRDWLVTTRRRIADGWVPPEPPAIDQRRREALDDTVNPTFPRLEGGPDAA